MQCTGATPARHRVEPLPVVALLVARVMCQLALFVQSDKKASGGPIMASIHDSSRGVLGSRSLLVADTLGDWGKGLVDEHVRTWGLDCF